MYLRGNFHTAYLDEAVLDTLSTTSNLTTLALEFRLDFEELEIIVNGLPHLESLSIRAIDNKSGSTTTTSAQPHPADRISSLRLGYEAQTDRSSPSDYSAISDVQLAWLLEPAVAHGNLHCLNLSIMPDFDRRFQAGAPAGAVGAAGLANANAPPFASATIANLLVRCGASLECLMMQDIERTDQNHPGFASAPHSTPVLSSAPSIQDTDELSNLAHDDGKDSNFDYALLHLVNLRQLSLQFVYTGPDLLESLAHMQHLQHLELVGIPVHTPSATFAEYLETTFEALETLTLSGYLTGTRGDQAGWTGAGLRRVKQIARQRGLVATFV
ncbi:uncharacterized protein JCM15063_001779 [Sporobolomyces koalae]|uniref:uncharacterized protein n=1 Tax=Sporobolomyces koalae TaxID=500713 RepID=UPI00316BC508